MGERYIGIMSGTSLDGVDAALVEFDDDAVIVDTCTVALPDSLRTEAIDLIAGDVDSLNRAHRLGNHLTVLYAQAAQALHRRHGDEPVAAIGCHGQTLRHFPLDQDSPFTVQVVNGAMLAILTGLPCVTDFRRADIALGGQGAPLAPGFHAACLRSDHETRVILNLGGIANATLLPANESQPVIGFDTGPANALMDDWVRRRTGARFDADGGLAGMGRCEPALLRRLLDDPYFERPPPKSTGREYFGDGWLDARLAQVEAPGDADVQATLLALTTRTIADAIVRHCADAEAIYACGGGSRNAVLMARLAEELAPRRLSTTEALGIDPQWIEATAFAWLARRRIKGLPGNVPTVTGASREAVLGALYLP